MDWNYPVNKFFELNEEQQNECIIELAQFYSKKFISKRTRELFEFTTNDLITKLLLEERHASETENFERAEIFYRLAQIFMELQEKDN